MRKIMIAAAAITLMMTMAVLTACTSDNDDNLVNGVDGRMVGKWCADVSGKTFAKWNYGETWQVTELKANGTGTTDIYYTNKDKPIAREHRDFTYSAAEAAALTEGLKKADGAMIAKFDAWDKTEDLIPVPQPAKFTVFVYGNAGGTMDSAIEKGFWEVAKKFLTDDKNVRVVCFYKYGKDLPDAPFSGKYANPGDIVWFELNSETDLNHVKEEGFQAMGFSDQAIRLKLCDPNALRMFVEISSLVCPAEQYVFGVWGHGSGFQPMYDVPGKYQVDARQTTRGVMTDEWNNGEWMDMYEMRDAIRAAGIDRLYTLFFHNCYMGNIETLTEIRDCADYICCSSHVLSSEGEVMAEFVRGLVNKGNAEDAMAQMFERITPVWQDEYRETFVNGDYKMIRTDRFDAILDAAKQLADRLVALYPTQKNAIDRATGQVYHYQKAPDYQYTFFDIANYAQLLARETGDAEFAAIADEMDRAFSDAFVHYRDVNNSKDHLDHYTLSVHLMHQGHYTFDFKPVMPDYLCNIDEGYEQSTFHKLTGWGNWLRMNLQPISNNPVNGGGGAME